MEPSKLIAPMLAKGFPDKTKYEQFWNSSEYWAEPKIDETRHLFYVEGSWMWAYSRTISKVTNFYVDNADKVPQVTKVFRHWQQEFLREHGTLPGLTIFDGGLMRGKDLAGVSSVLNMTVENAAKAQAGGKRIEAIIWDLPYYDGKDLTRHALSTRRKILEQIASKYGWETRVQWKGDSITPVVLIPKLEGSAQEKKDYYGECIEAGYEGIMLKYSKGPYEPGRRSTQWIKVKKLDTWDVVIMRLIKGTNSNADVYSTFAWGQYIGDSLTELGVCGGLTQAMMVDMTKHPTNYIGQVVEIAGQERTVHGDVRHPRFIRMRTDKSPRQCVYQPNGET